MTDDPFLLDAYLKKRSGEDQNELPLEKDKKDV